MAAPQAHLTSLTQRCWESGSRMWPKLTAEQDAQGMISLWPANHLETALAMQFFRPQQAHTRSAATQQRVGAPH